ncbi:MAG: hypothetical protein IKW02_00935 [Clostridia bacterium]|nr:hypothetical protein [Clostridia bacterium]
MYLGIDTSCYTTSVAIVSPSGEIAADRRILLSVGEGKRGLRQSEAVFQHVKNLPLLIEEVREFLPNVKGVAVSAKPRNAEDSYMPVFVAGQSFAKAVAASLDVPLILTDHQSGHIMAASKSAEFEPNEKFIAIHLSGGTTEFLLTDGEKTEIIGKTLDIPAGQLVDRTGVMCGASFPCGKEMDGAKLPTKIKLPVSVKGCDINFSGAEIQAQRLFESGAPCGEIYTAVFECIARSLEKAAKNAGDYHILPVGGVSSNTLVRSHLEDAFGEKVHFAHPKYMTDNAVGVACICREILL